MKLTVKKWAKQESDWIVRWFAFLTALLGFWKYSFEVGLLPFAIALAYGVAVYHATRTIEKLLLKRK